MADTTRGRVRVEQSTRRIRVYLDGALAADTTRPVLVWESPHYPTYYIPRADVRAGLTPTGAVDHSPSRGDAQIQDVTIDTAVAKAAARVSPDSPIEELRDTVRFDFGAFQWFEEDEPVFVHPRNPYTRVDILGSSRHIRVELDGVVVAESRQPRVLFETGLPARYYLPITDYDQSLLVASDTETHCPYKGTANYYSVKIGEKVYEDLIWFYATPLPESQKIAGLAAPWNEKMEIFVDGVLEEKPKRRG